MIITDLSAAFCRLRDQLPSRPFHLPAYSCVFQPIFKEISAIDTSISLGNLSGNDRVILVIYIHP